MKALTFIRGVLFMCAGTLVYVANPAKALAAGSQSTDSFEQTKLHLTESSGTHASSASLGSTAIRTLVGLLVVVALIYALTWVIRKTKAAGTGNAALGNGLEQVASLPLGTGRAVTLVRVGDELHLLGVAEHGVSDLRIFTEEEAYELGIPFHPDNSGSVDDGSPLTRVLAALRRRTIR